MGLAELEEIAGLVTAEFGDRGYTLARAYIPAQDIQDGIVEIVVVEGKVGEIIVKGNKNYSTDFIKRGFTPVVEQSVIKHSSLEKSLLLLNEYPDLKLKATLEAGKEPGTTDIVATVEDRLPGSSNGGLRQLRNRVRKQKQVRHGGEHRKIPSRGGSLAFAARRHWF
jgi:hemolysin activation/secretion protein